jgi:hypothetical protein
MSNDIVDSASSCLTQLVMGKVDVYWLSTLMVALDPAMVTLMSWTNFFGINPELYNFEYYYCAFSMDCITLYYKPNTCMY